MTPDNDVTLGEVYRLVQTLGLNVDTLRTELKADSHSIRNRMQEQALIIGRLDLRMTTVETRALTTDEDAEKTQADVDKIKLYVENLNGRAAMVGLGAGLISYLLQFIPLPWIKH